jgi:hypothetical protein
MYIVKVEINVMENVMNNYTTVIIKLIAIVSLVMVITKNILVQHVMFTTLTLVIDISAANRHVVQGCTWGVLKVMIADLVQKILTAQEEHLSLFPVHQGQ